MPAGMDIFLNKTRADLDERLRTFLGPIYQAGDLAAARLEADKQLDQSLKDIDAAFGFPDAIGMGVMSEVTATVAAFMVDAGDLAGARELIERPWAFNGGEIAVVKERIDKLEGKS